MKYLSMTYMLGTAILVLCLTQLFENGMWLFLIGVVGSSFALGMTFAHSLMIDAENDEQSKPQEVRFTNFNDV